MTHGLDVIRHCIITVLRETFIPNRFRLPAATCRQLYHALHVVTLMHVKCLDSEHKLSPMVVKMKVSDRPGHK